MGYGWIVGNPETTCYWSIDVKSPISLIDEGEQTARSCANACFRLFRDNPQSTNAPPGF